MKLEFDETKEYTVEELEELRSEYYQISRAISDKLTQTRIKDYDFTGKYVYSDMYGYMFVTWQLFDNKDCIYGDARMFFQGLQFNACLGEYRDDAYYNFDALNEWRIPINTFLDDIKSGKFKEITKDEFMKVITDNTSKLMGEIDEWVNYVEKELNKKD